MAQHVSDIAFTPTVKAQQVRLGSRTAYARMEGRGGWSNRINPELARFIGERDSFYLGTASADGQPYIQHRGGPKGFLKVIDDRTLAMADFVGNAQYISVGNLDENDKAYILLMDYPNRQRYKLWGRAEFVEDDDELAELVSDPDYNGRVERVLVFHIDAWDRNCPQHIKRRFAEEDVAARVGELEGRIADLEAENARLRAATAA